MRLADNPNFVWLRRQVDGACRQQVLRARRQGHPPGARVQAQVSRGRSRRACRRLHQRRGPRPGGHRARLPEGSRRPRRHAPRHQGPARPRRRGHRRQRRAGRRPRHRARDRLEGAVLRLPAHPRRGRREQGQGRQRRRARRADRRGARAGELPELFAGGPAQPERRAAAQPRADRHLRARLDDEAVHRRAGRSRPAASRRAR